MKDIIGASAIIEKLPETFKTVLKDFFDLDTPKIISEAAGAFRIQIDDEVKALEIYKKFPVFASLYAPGLTLLSDLRKIEDENDASVYIIESILEIQKKRNHPQIQCAPVSPLIERNPRTGLPAVKCDEGKNEFIDLESEKKRELSWDAKSRLYKEITGMDLNENAMDKMFHREDNSFLCVLHADGNSLGEIITQLAEVKEGFLEKFQNFSKAVSEATKTALQNAYKCVLKSCDVSDKKNDKIHFLPLIVGGDDITVVLESPRAFKFVKKFIINFEKLSSKKLDCELRKTFSKLTVCAGLAFVNRKYPISQAVDLAGELCDYAKSVSKKEKKENELNFVPSSFQYYRLTDTLLQSYEDIIENKLNNENIKYCAGPYFVGWQENESAGKLKKFDELVSFSEKLKNFPRGVFRGLIDRLKYDPESIDIVLGRMQELYNNTLKKEEIIDNSKISLLYDSIIYLDIAAAGSEVSK